jgi:hypothetical protein
MLKKLIQDLELESVKLRKEKDSVILLNEKYNTPNTSLLLFHFDPQAYRSSDLRLRGCSINSHSVDERYVYLFDDFFLEEESENLRNYSRQATFSRQSYAAHESRERGEVPARSMDNKEKWQFFAKPPQAVNEMNKLLGWFAFRLNADITTLPWDICDDKICASAVATNRLERVTKESMEMGKHGDFNTEEGIPFAIPMLYKEKGGFPGQFINGAPGNPLLVSLMLYATEDNFRPEFGIGTNFYNKKGELAHKAECLHTRFVLFEGDIVHTIEESHIPKETETWRISYVYKLILNPKAANQNIKAELYNLLKSY